MRTQEDAIIHDCFSFLEKSSKHTNLVMAAIYYRRNKRNAVDVVACAENPTRTVIVAFDPYKDTAVNQRVCNDNFQYLEDGYQILYMPIETHLSQWNDINNKSPEHKDGLQKYLLYCHQHGISKNLIDSLSASNINDVMPMLHEINCDYAIITSMDIEKISIVIGYNPNAPLPYVVWECDVNRKYGYRNGSYCSTKKGAVNAFNSRCREHVDRTLNMKSSCLISRKEKGDHER